MVFPAGFSPLEYGDPMEKIWHSVRTLVTVVAVLGVLSACVTSSPQSEDTDSAATERCKEGFADAEVRLDAHYAKWGVVDPADFDQEEAEWSAAIDPLYDACSSAAEFMETGKLYPAVFGVTGAEFVDAMTVQIYCSGHESRPACTGAGELT